MRAIIFTTVVVVIGFTMSSLAVAPSPAQLRIPPDFTFEQDKDSPAPVTFSHERHKEKFEKCTACHIKIFKMKRGTTGNLTMAAMEQGKTCGACHDGKTAFSVKDEASCSTCHVKK